MKGSASIINTLLTEVDSLTYRIRSIKQTYKTTSNYRLRGRLIFEIKNIIKRVSEIYKISELLNKRKSDNITFSYLLMVKSKRTLNETKYLSNLYFS